VLSLIADLFVPGIRWLAAAIGGGLVSFSASGAGEDGLEFTPLDTLAPAQGIFAAQQIKPQARTLAEDRGIRCVVLDYDALRGTESDEFRLF
jgi:hypothetical protein